MTAPGNRRPMRRLRRSERGLSEIVGTLMLVIIVVAAATLLAAFVASYQKQLQTEESFTHDQNLESIHVLSLSTEISSGAFTSFAFTLASEYVNPSVVEGISLNSVPLLQFSWKNVTTGTTGTYAIGQNFVVAPFDQIIITLDLNPSDTTFSFLNPSDVPTPNHYIKFDIYTTLQNDFTKVFLPPTPFAVVSEINPSGTDITLLDGSMSFQPGGNSSLVEWDWTVTSGGLTSTATSLLAATFTEGVTTPANGAFTPGTVNATGATANFTVPSGFNYGTGYGLANAAAFMVGGNLTVTGTGTCTLSDSFITAVTKSSVAVPTLNLTFSFTTTISAGCMGATLHLAVSGVTLVLSGSGEEVEITPALPTLTGGETPYVVTLAVTNSDGLQGTVDSSYTPPP